MSKSVEIILPFSFFKITFYMFLYAARVIDLKDNLSADKNVVSIFSPKIRHCFYVAIISPTVMVDSTTSAIYW